MNFTLNNKYFNGSNPLFWIGGLAALALGFCLLFIQDMLAIGILLGVAALIYLGVYFGKLAKDSDITDGLKIRLEQLRNEARADFEAQFARAKKFGSPKIFESTRFLYEPKEPGVILKARKSAYGEIFTSRYAMTLLYVDDHNRSMYIYTFKLSLIEDDDEMEITKLAYGGFEKAWLTERETPVAVGDKSVMKKSVELHIDCRDGSKITFPTVRDASTESLIQDMNMRYNKPAVNT